MARIRTVKPDIWGDDKTGMLGPRGQLLFIGLISIADDEGYLRGHPAYIKGQIWPYHDLSSEEVQMFLDELQENELVLQYGSADGSQRYIRINNWAKHQRVSHPKKSTFPKPHSKLPSRELENAVRAGDYVNECGKPLQPLGHEGEGEGDMKGEGTNVPMSDAERQTPPKPQKQSKHSKDVQAVWEHWLKVCGPIQLAEPSRAKLTKGRASHIRARLAEGYSVDDLVRSISGFALSPHHTGENDRETAYLEPKTILKSGEQVEAGWAYGSKPAGQPRAKRRGVESDWSHLTGGGAA